MDDDRCVVCDLPLWDEQVDYCSELCEYLDDWEREQDWIQGFTLQARMIA